MQQPEQTEILGIVKTRDKSMLRRPLKRDRDLSIEIGSIGP